MARLMVEERTCGCQGDGCCESCAQRVPGSLTPARRGGWIQTYSGRQFWPLDPRPEEIHVDDIAHALAHQCRFSGHVREFYSVAEHCVRVSLACDPEDALWGLLHDAAEAYLVDLPRPIKHSPELAVYREAEARVLAAIAERFGLPPEIPESVRRADDILLATEARDLSLRVHPEWKGLAAPLEETILPLGPKDAEKAWLVRLLDLAYGG